MRAAPSAASKGRHCWLLNDRAQACANLEIATPSAGCSVQSEAVAEAGEFPGAAAGAVAAGLGSLLTDLHIAAAGEEHTALPHSLRCGSVGRPCRYRARMVTRTVGVRRRE